MEAPETQVTKSIQLDQARHVMGLLKQEANVIASTDECSHSHRGSATKSVSAPSIFLLF